LIRDESLKIARFSHMLFDVVMAAAKFGST
jgi:hypothetical protein